jgi:tRNA nucleotidyltransferase (CCA-adding enzyme)
MTTREIDTTDVGAALRAAYPELGALAASTESVYLVGGAVRDLLLGHGRADIDVVVVGDPAALAERLGAETIASHDRFGTAKVKLDGHELDIAAARTESYEAPGALPTVSPAADVETDLARRDFTVNAIAIPLRGDPELIDPHGGVADLRAGLLRVLHPGSFADDPTRALRAARYAARFDLVLDPETEALLRATDLDTVSADRRRAELRRLAAETSAPRGFALLAEWGLVELRPGGAELAADVAEVLETEVWNGEVELADAVLAAALGPAGGEEVLARTEPARPSEGVAAARSRSGIELVLARVLGAEWLDEYAVAWRHVALEINGEDLIAAGAPRGPALGRGLAAALEAKLDGEIAGREAELETALAAALQT